MTFVVGGPVHVTFRTSLRASAKQPGRWSFEGIDYLELPCKAYQETVRGIESNGFLGGSSKVEMVSWRAVLPGTFSPLA